jgi:general secretion pathway protein G
MQRSNNKGFTLVEILIVVIILGILAAIVIPQFSNASTDAKKNSLMSQLQTMRSQMELYKLQHNDQLPTKLAAAGLHGGTGAEADWDQLTGQTDVSGTSGTATAQKYGPYLQQVPANSLNGLTSINCDATSDFPSLQNKAAPAAAGFIMNSVTGKIWATAVDPARMFNEADPSDPLNDKAATSAP